ncbi:MAG TPA: helix-turn-helix domain-containing protein [Sedimentisphaerales bacterium]|nr:helix-turn-helix domain-containing protein [Sedimentisphaerales bacterium]
MNAEHEITISPLLLTPREAARTLSICERTLYGLTKVGELRVVKIGRAVRYDVGDLRAWIERAKKSSESP